MAGPKPTSAVLALVVTALCTLICAALLTPPASAATTVSANWAGYVAAPRASARFSSVSGIWRQPAASCTLGRASFAAVWVGLGGYGEGVASLEQIGTDANCSADGHAAYASWFELLPADPVAVKLKVSPGDLLAASVTMSGRHVTLRIRNLTTGARFSTTRHYAHPDGSTAEWIVEAPSSCSGQGVCTTLPLADFATVPFSIATASVRGHTGGVQDPLWSTAAIELRQGASDTTGPGASVNAHLAGNVVRATPSAVSRSRSFAVSWSQSSGPGEPASAPSLPGFGGTRR